MHMQVPCKSDEPPLNSITKMCLNRSKTCTSVTSDLELTKYELVTNIYGEHTPEL